MEIKQKENAIFQGEAKEGNLCGCYSALLRLEDGMKKANLNAMQ